MRTTFGYFVHCFTHLLCQCRVLAGATHVCQVLAPPRWQVLWYLHILTVGLADRVQATAEKRKTKPMRTSRNVFSIYYYRRNLTATSLYHCLLGDDCCCCCCYWRCLEAKQRGYSASQPAWPRMQQRMLCCHRHCCYRRQRSETRSHPHCYLHYICYSYLYVLLDWTDSVVVDGYAKVVQSSDKQHRYPGKTQSNTTQYHQASVSKEKSLDLHKRNSQGIYIYLVTILLHFNGIHQLYTYVFSKPECCRLVDLGHLIERQYDSYTAPCIFCHKRRASQLVHPIINIMWWARQHFLVVTLLSW